MPRYMTEKERKALAEFVKELEEDLKELRKKVNKKVDSH